MCTFIGIDLVSVQVGPTKCLAPPRSTQLLHMPRGNGNLNIWNGKASFFGTKKTKTQDFKAEKYKNPDIVSLHNLHTILQC